MKNTTTRKCWQPCSLPHTPPHTCIDHCTLNSASLTNKSTAQRNHQAPQAGPTAETHLSKRPLLALLPDNYVGDALNSTLQEGSAQHGAQLVLRKKMFKRDHKSPSNAEHLTLAFGQVAGDFHAGVYPPLHADAARLAALQLVARHGAGLLGDAGGMAAALPSVLPAVVLASNTPDAWAAEVGACYATLVDLSAAECQLLLLAAVAKLPYGTIDNNRHVCVSRRERYERCR